MILFKVIKIGLFKTLLIVAVKRTVPVQIYLAVSTLQFHAEIVTNL